MTIYLSTSSDGCNTDGIGVMVQSQLFVKALSEIFNCNYKFNKFTNFTHYQYFNITQENFMNDINQFFNLQENQEKLCKKVEISTEEELNQHLKNPPKEDIELSLYSGLVTRLGQKYLEEFESKNSIKKIKEKFNFKNLSDTSKFRIAIHIRIFTHTDCDLSSFRDYFTLEKQEYYINLLESLREIYKEKNPQFEIYSQGNSDLFNFLKEKDTSFFIEEYPIYTIEKMLTSDVFVMANSSLSYIVHLLRDKITYCKQGFYHKTYNNLKLFIGYDGII
jgi:hypothetical protein